jgi:hypothetical protein
MGFWSSGHQDWAGGTKFRQHVVRLLIVLVSKIMVILLRTPIEAFHHLMVDFRDQVCGTEWLPKNQ